MATATHFLTTATYEYLKRVSLHEHPVLSELRAVTEKHERAVMQTSPEQAQLMQILIKLSGAQTILELGVFTGYSTLAMALALPENGRIIACDVDPESTAIAEEFWKKAGVSHKITLRLMAGVTLLNKLHEDGEILDCAFIDADKENYDQYYEGCLRVLKSGGLMMIDNTLWEGKVVDEDAQDPDTRSIRALNAKLCADERIDISMVPIGDGLTLAVKK